MKEGLIAEQPSGRERASINPAGARPQLCVILGRKGGYSEQGLSQLLGKERQWRGGTGGGMACRRGHPLPWRDRVPGPPERWNVDLKDEVSSQGRGCGPLPQLLLSRVDRPVLPWQPDWRLTAKKEPLYLEHGPLWKPPVQALGALWEQRSGPQSLLLRPSTQEPRILAHCKTQLP